MADDDAFLRAIIDNPDDDLPRLVYADWLDEHGDAARAEFIRVQCELARVSSLDAATRRRLENRAAELLSAHRGEWLGPLKELVDCRHQMRLPLFERGFVATVGMPAAVFLTHAERVFEVAPVVGVRLENAWEEADKL